MNSYSRPVRPDIIAVFTDGAATTNENYPLRNSIGALLNHKNKSNLFAEVMAIEICLDRLPPAITSQFHIFVVTDSLFVIKGLQIIDYRRKQRTSLVTEKSFQDTTVSDGFIVKTKKPKKEKIEIPVKPKEGGKGWTPKEIDFEENYRPYLNRFIDRAGTFKQGLTLIFNPAHTRVLGNEVVDIYGGAPLYDKIKELVRYKIKAIVDHVEEESKHYISVHWEISPGDTGDWDHSQRPQNYEEFVTEVPSSTLGDLAVHIKEKIPDAFIDENQEKMQNLRDALKKIRKTPSGERQPLEQRDFFRMVDMDRLRRLTAAGLHSRSG